MARSGRTSSITCRMCDSVDLEPAGTVEGWTFVTCRTCAFTFTPQITPEQLHSDYSQGRHGVHEGAPETGWGKDLGFLQPALERRGPGPILALDFGTGNSPHPQRLREQGHRCIAVDLMPPLRPHPDRLTGDIMELPLEPRSFDLVFSYQVLEHLPEPRPILERLLELTRPGGHLLVHTDMEMPERHDAGFENWWYVLPPDHCSFYRHRTFEHFTHGRPHRIPFCDQKRVLIEAWGTQDPQSIMGQ